MSTTNDVSDVWKRNTIIKKLDGTYTIFYKNGPYQVCSKELDDRGLYDINEVASFWESLPLDDVRKVAEEPPTPLTNAELVAKLKSELASIRWNHATGGINVAGFEIDTNTDSQLLISGAVSLAMVKPETVFKFKTKTGFVDLTSQIMIYIGASVGTHIQLCYAHEAVLAAMLDPIADDREALLAFDLEQGWP